MITFQRELIWNLWDEAIPLLLAHWREIAHYQDIRLDPDIESYNAAEQAGLLRVFTARDSDSNELAGYAVYFVRANMHYRHSRQAVQDVLFLSERYRLGMTGVRLIKYADEELAREGVQVVMHHVKAAHDFGRILERIGYELVDLIYARRLDHGRIGSNHRTGSAGGGVGCKGVLREGTGKDPGTGAARPEPGC